MEITTRDVGDITILSLLGRLVLDEGDIPFRDCVNQLVQQGRVNIVVDMGKVTRLDSMGIGMLVSKYVTTYLRGGRLKLLNLTARGETLMDVTKLHGVFEIFESEDVAIRSFERARARQATRKAQKEPPKR